MANAFRKQMNKDSNWINNVWFSDEAHFYLDNYINSQNSRTWAKVKPDAMMGRPEISVEMCVRVIENFQKRAELGIERDGNHFKHRMK